MDHLDLPFLMVNHARLERNMTAIGVTVLTQQKRSQKLKPLSSRMNGMYVK
jgi:hypothetical protein